ncbi:putative ABC transport system permease protein [Litoreibacter ponti]|uniref:Putative ABC transport system permease protein n=1 Tax=Litoreibacter ponti TaxID=1510457 RepID=A0A2T6BML6_9RHOB|nr:FtsX-like permease family protein [Litoreibacter ponti]PTX57328.1 putative ABC transport system permease protein [Litoreibacter ponti]
MSLSWRIARRELRGGLKGFRVFLACLALGVAAIAAIGTVRSAIEAGLSEQGAVILGGDAEVQLTYRYATDEERAWLDAQGEVSEIVDFRSMLVTGDERALTQVKGVDGLYPLYGQARLTPDIPIAEALQGDGTTPGALVDPVLLDRLGLKVGDLVKLGQTEFLVTASLDRLPDTAGGGFSLGPPTVVASEALKDSGLVTPGTLFETEYRIRTDRDVTAMEAEAREVLDGTGYRWRDRRNGAPGISEFVERLSAFLVLVGLTGLAVGGVGVSAAVRAYLSEKTAVIATLRTLGASGATVFKVYLMQIGVLAAIGIALGLALGAIAPLLFAPIIEARLPVPVDFAFRPLPLVEAALYGALAAGLFTLWPLAQAQDIRAAALFREARAGVSGWPRPVWIIACAALLAALVGTAAWLSGLVTLTLWASGGILAAFVLLLLAALGIRHLSRKLARLKPLRRAHTLRAALGAVGGPGREAQSVVVSLGLGLSVLAAVGQIDWNLRNAITTDLPEVAPSYFVVDIQPDQLEPLTAQLSARESVSEIDTAPMLRGVITGINGARAADVAGDHWVLQGDRGITYAATPPDRAEITAGAWWPEDYTGPPQISFAAEEAEEMGLKLGDTLTVNILGRDITAEITSFREVNFGTGGIGFIMSMNPAALQGAPHTHIATVYSTPEDEGALLRDMAKAYPNVTAIRVRDAIARVSEVLQGIAAAITYGALATLVTGGIVLIGTAATGERARVYEGAVLKSLGASRAHILANFALRSALLGLTAGVIALAAGIAAGWGVSVFVMETEFSVALPSALGIIAGGIAATVLTGLMFAWRPLAARPAQVLRARE